jgi:hypothetical protein
MGGKSSSKSEANQQTTTTNQDNRIVNESGIVATTGASIVANIESMDGDIVNKALDFAATADGNNKDAFSKLIDFAADTFATGAQMISAGQQQVIDAAQSVQADKQGSIDQKTMIVLGVAAASALVLVKGKN